MKRLRKLAGKLWLLMFPDRAPEPAGPGRSVLSRLATPHTFNPNLSFGEALVAIAGSLARIFSTCALLAVWGGVSAMAWVAIENHFWGAVAVLLLVLLFLAVLAALMIGISAMERRIGPRR